MARWRIMWNRKTQTYTVYNGSVTIRGIVAKTQAICVKMEMRAGLTPSFGEISP